MIKQQIYNAISRAWNTALNYDDDISALSDDNINTKNSLTTGINVGGFLSPYADPTLFDISDGDGMVINGSLVDVAWTGLTGLTAAYRLTDSISFIAIDEFGAVIQQAGDFSFEQRRDLIVLGTLIHTVTDIIDTNDSSHSVDTYLANDLSIAVGDINKEGNNYNPVSTDLTIRKESGVSFLFNANREANTKDPNNLTSGVQSPATFLTVNDDGSGGATIGLPTTTIDPDFYDNGSGTLVALGNNKWSNKLIYFFPQSNLTFVRYGNEEFASQAKAEAAIGTIPPKIGTGFETSLVRTTLTVKKGTTNLSLPENVFTSTGKFGLEGGGGGIASSTLQDLQDVYDHSVTPEIITDSTRGAFTVRRGSVEDADNIIEGENGSGAAVFSVDGNGNIALAGEVDGRNVAEDGAALDAITTSYSRRLAVKNIVDNTALPPTEVTNDRYILDFTGASNAAWDGAAAGDIVEFNGTIWIAITPLEGYISYIDDQNKDALYVDDGVMTWELRNNIASVELTQTLTQADSAPNETEMLSNLVIDDLRLVVTRNSNLFFRAQLKNETGAAIDVSYNRRTFGTSNVAGEAVNENVLDDALIQFDGTAYWTVSLSDTVEVNFVVDDLNQYQATYKGHETDPTKYVFLTFKKIN